MGIAARDPGRENRARRLRAEQQAAADADARAVAAGVAETVALSRARGASIVAAALEGEARAPGRRGPRATPYRRQTGLDWLFAKGRIDASAKAAGERYGAIYRRVKADTPIRSTLDIRPGRGQPPEAPLGRLLAHAEGTEQARARLGTLRRHLWSQVDLVGACDLICGEELTPREAAGADRDAARLEAVLKVALEVLAGAGRA